MGKAHSAFVFPAVYSNLMFLDVCSEDYFLTAIYFQPMAEQLRIFHGNASACHHLSTAFKSYFQIFVTLYSTAKSTIKEVRVASAPIPDG